jgi:hypothetical protein
VLSSVTLWTTSSKPLGALANFLVLIPETPNLHTRNHESKYLKPRSFVLKTPNLLTAYSKPRIIPLPYLKPRIATRNPEHAHGAT